MSEQDNLIIESPHLQTALQKYSHAFITFFFWMLWVYLWSPIITMLFWALGFHQLYHHMVLLEGYHGLAGKLLTYMAIILAIGFIQVAWAKYNQFRFRGKEKRNFQPRVSSSALFDYFNVDKSKINTFQKGQVLKLSLGSLSGIAHVQDITAAIKEADWAVSASASLGRMKISRRIQRLLARSSPAILLNRRESDYFQTRRRTVAGEKDTRLDSRGISVLTGAESAALLDIPGGASEEAGSKRKKPGKGGLLSLQSCLSSSEAQYLIQSSRSLAGALAPEALSSFDQLLTNAETEYLL